MNESFMQTLHGMGLHSCCAAGAASDSQLPQQAARKHPHLRRTASLQGVVWSSGDKTRGEPLSFMTAADWKGADGRRLQLPAW